MTQRVFITGASSGLGLITAAKPAKAGFAVVASMGDPSKGHAHP